MARLSSSEVVTLPDDDVGALVEVGLTLTQARTYRALLEISPATARAIADRARVPRPKVYEALDSLKEMGFCAPAGGDVAKYMAVPPSTALDEWRSTRDEERRLVSDRDASIVNALVKRLPAPGSLDTADSGTGMHALVGKEATAGAFERLLKSASQRLEIVQTTPIVQRRSRWNLVEREALARGVDVRVLCTAETASDPARWEPLVVAGGQARVSSGSVLKLVVRDGEEALVTLEDPEADPRVFTAVRIRHPDLVTPLQLLFRREWRRARPLIASNGGTS